ncbi:MAG: PilC/PilY family type IV pilus protein [Acidobacteriota bacterium]|nr:PilC/PilY family type IV pilus protein [Acidobacteriota bacterium]
MKRPAAAQGSSTLLITLILLLLSGSCLALLMATQTQLLVASQHKVQVRLLAAADGGVELGVARGIAGAGEPIARILGGSRPGAEVLLELSGFVPMAHGACHLCMTNLEGTLGSLGGLRRVSHVVSATANASRRSDGLPPPVRSVSAVVDLMPWPAENRDRWDLAVTMAAARRRIRQAAPAEVGGYAEGAPVAVARFEGDGVGAARVVAVGGSGRALHAVEIAPRPGPLWSFADATDEDGNGAPDLGRQLTAPAIVRLRLGEVGLPVAVFGGGYDRDRPHDVGNWLYIVGVDSGRLLHKRRLDAPVTASPAVADLDGDGVADRIYVGTLAGGLYRVDLSTSARLAGGRVAADFRVPRRVFETGGRPIRQPPAIVPVPEIGGHVLALGADGRIDLPASREEAAGRFFVLVDRGAGSIVSAGSVVATDLSGGVPGPDRLAPELSPSDQGWSLALERGEEIASPPLAAAGLLTFLTFRSTRLDGGVIRRYSLLLRSGDAATGGARGVPVASGVSRPSGDFGSPTRLDVDHPGRVAAPLLSPGEERLLETLRAGMPGSCRFGGARLRLAGAGIDARPFRLAVLPVCRIDVDWFEDRMF